MSLTEQVDRPKPAMRTKVVDEYATIFRTHHLEGPVLEIAGGPRNAAISHAPFLSAFERHVIVKGESAEANGTHFHKGDPNDLGPLFDDACFSTVIWDRALERDHRFWLTVAEIKRVLMPGGTLVLCTRGFAKNNKFGIKVVSASGKGIPFLTATGALSETSSDNLRFSPRGLRKVVLDGFETKELRSSFMAPHLFAVAVKQAARA